MRDRRARIVLLDRPKRTVKRNRTRAAVARWRRDAQMRADNVEYCAAKSILSLITALSRGPELAYQ